MDLSWFEMNIYLTNNKKIHLKNLAFFKKENNKFIRIKTKPEDIRTSQLQTNQYRDFLFSLVQKIQETKLDN